MVIDQKEVRSPRQPEREPAQVFDFNLDALDKVVGSMFDQNDPAEGGHHEKG
jgi:hypothetical protein